MLDTQEVIRSPRPDRMLVYIEGLDTGTAKAMAEGAVYLARRNMPKVSGAGARGLKPTYGKGYFGIIWSDNYVWFQEHGINPFTMKSLAGKLIPMWVDPATLHEKERERMSSGKMKTRTTEDGRVQVLIFRRAGKKPGDSKSSTKSKVSKKYPYGHPDSPSHYPGQAGRIVKREAPAPYTTPGKRPGAIAKGNVGVYWRHPGITPRGFLNYSLTVTAQQFGYRAERIIVCDSGTRF